MPTFGIFAENLYVVCKSVFAVFQLTRFSLCGIILRIKNSMSGYTQNNRSAVLEHDIFGERRSTMTKRTKVSVISSFFAIDSSMGIRAPFFELLI